MNTTITYKKGFTLIESLVAVTMLSLVIASVMGLAQTSIAGNTYAQAQVTANYLAGEALEYIRNQRDNQFLQYPNDIQTTPSLWLDGIDGSCFNTGCDVDTVNSTFISCQAECVPLQFSSNINGGFYQHGNMGSNSTFRRTIFIEEINDYEIAVRVVISGDSGFFKQTPLVVVEHMSKWYKP
ncbi:MAG: type II secretion system protein [Nitrosopumilus sp.]|nr:type II secretion system protein [Nitrosopumilus sp.]MBA3550796.1 type II secretion system protein [Patescibacteria group bacterium]